MIQLTWLSHASWLIETPAEKLLLDPFFGDNPKATVSAEQFGDVTHVLLSHGHADHVSDAAAVIEASGAQLIAPYEIVQWFSQKHGISNAIGMNVGGKTVLGSGSVKMVPAIHSSSLPDGSYGGPATGFILSFDGRRIYFACDTAFFTDMKWYAGGVDVAVLPIGDLFTMGIHDSIEAVKIIQPRIVLPTHYDTWPPIEQDARDWAEQVSEKTGSKPVVLKVDETYQV